MPNNNLRGEAASAACLKEVVADGESPDVRESFPSKVTKDMAWRYLEKQATTQFRPYARDHSRRERHFFRLRDHNQPVGVCVAFPGILDLGERNTLGLDAQCAAGCAVHHLLERVGEYLPRRHASGS
jgi:hypothetical protein